AEVLPDKKPADTVLEALKGIPVGTPVEEIKRVSDAFGLDFVFVRAVAKIESDFDPKQRSGSSTRVLSRPEITAAANTFRENTGATNAEYVLPNTSDTCLARIRQALLRTINR